MLDYVKIQTLRIPAKYPTKDFYEIKYFEDRIVREGYHKEIHLTKKKFKTTIDDTYLNRAIQTTHWDKYRLTLFAKEYIQISDLQLAEIVDITAMNGVTHRAVIIDIPEPEKLDITQNYKYEVVYYDVNKANYKDNTAPVSNYLEKATILDYLSSSNLWQLRIRCNTDRLTGGLYIDSYFDSVTGGEGKYNFYTKLVPEESSTSENIYASNKTKRTLLQTVYKNKYSVTFFINETDKNILQKYGNACDTIQLINGLTTYTSQEELSITIEESEYTNLWQCNIIFTTAISYTNYAESSVLALLTTLTKSTLTVVYNSVTYTYYSIITPVFGIESPDPNDEKLGTGLNIMGKIVIQNSVLVTLYLSESLKNQLLSMLPVCYTGSPLGSAVFNYNSTNYTNLEPIVSAPENIEGGIDIYKVEFKLKYLNTEITPYV